MLKPLSVESFHQQRQLKIPKFWCINTLLSFVSSSGCHSNNCTKLPHVLSISTLLVHFFTSVHSPPSATSIQRKHHCNNVVNEVLNTNFIYCIFSKLCPIPHLFFIHIPPPHSTPNSPVLSQFNLGGLCTQQDYPNFWPADLKMCSWPRIIVIPFLHHWNKKSWLYVSEWCWVWVKFEIECEKKSDWKKGSA